jgi:putative flippase GtrA
MFKAPQFLKFGIAGIFNTAVDWSTYFLFSKVFHYNEILAKIGGVFIGVLSAFILNSFWVFYDSFKIKLHLHILLSTKFRFLLFKFFQFVIVYSVGMLINVLAFSLIYKITENELLSLSFATACSFLINFLLSKKYVFHYKSF